MTDGPGKTAHIEALRLLEAFAKAGSTTFDLTLTTRGGDKVHFRRQLPLDHLKRLMPELLDGSTRLERNVIVRPHGPGVEFIQLDDLTAQDIERVKPAAFLCLQTSPGNYQAWVAVRDPGDPDFARRLRKGAGADPSASGATRVAGHPNFKDKYAPNFPRVEITHLAAGRIASSDELAALKLVARVEKSKPLRPRVSPARPGVRKWPSYQRCVEGAPPNPTSLQRCRIDFVWSMTALDWGWSIEDTAKRLLEESSKARENGEQYALSTAQNAAAAVERRRGQVAKK